jgi:outer membrane protein assembly factor BamD (BamD/ComL family)
LNELDKILKDIPQTKIGDKILFTIAYIRFKQEDYDEVLSTLNRLLSSYPKTVLKYEVNLMAADTLFFQKKFADARVAYLKVGYQLAEEREVLEDEYSNIPPTPRAKKELLAEAQLGVANCYKRLSEYQSAIVEYQKVLDLYPDTASADDACFFLADIYDRIHSVRDLERAVEIYRMLIERYPESIWADRAKERKRYLEENYL